MKSTAWLAAHLRKRTPKPVMPDHAVTLPADRTPQPDPARRYSAFIAP